MLNLQDSLNVISLLKQKHQQTILDYYQDTNSVPLSDLLNAKKALNIYNETQSEILNKSI